MDNTDIFLSINREIKDVSIDIESIADRYFSGASPRLRKLLVSNFSRMRKSALERRLKKEPGKGTGKSAELSKK